MDILDITTKDFYVDNRLKLLFSSSFLIKSCAIMRLNNLSYQKKNFNFSKDNIDNEHRRELNPQNKLPN